MGVSSGMVPAPFSFFVRHIFRIRAKEKVIRSAACGIVAAVADADTVMVMASWNLSVC